MMRARVKIQEENCIIALAERGVFREVRRKKNTDGRRRGGDSRKISH